MSRGYMTMTSRCFLLLRPRPEVAALIHANEPFLRPLAYENSTPSTTKKTQRQCHRVCVFHYSSIKPVSCRYSETDVFFFRGGRFTEFLWLQGVDCFDLHHGARLHIWATKISHGELEKCLWYDLATAQTSLLSGLLSSGSRGLFLFIHFSTVRFFVFIHARFPLSDSSTGSIAVGPVRGMFSWINDQGTDQQLQRKKGSV